jgi:hypothetical protein
MERTVETERRKVSKLERHLSQMQTVQSNVDRSLRLIDQKIALLTSAHFSGIHRSLNPSSSQFDTDDSAMMELLQTPLPDLNDPSAGGGGSGHRSTVKDSAKIHAMKSYLREKKYSLRESLSPSASPSRPLTSGGSPSSSSPLAAAAAGPPPPLSHFQDFEEEFGGSSVDSQGLLDEYVLERIDHLDTMVNDTLIKKFQHSERLSRQMTHELKTVQDTVKELEMVSADLTTKGGLHGGGALMDLDYFALQEKNFKTLSFDLRDHWEKVSDELERKLSRIDSILKQTSEPIGGGVHDSNKGNLATSAALVTALGGVVVGGGGGGGHDDITKKLLNFKHKMKLFFESFAQCFESSALSPPPPSSAGAGAGPSSSGVSVGAGDGASSNSNSSSNGHNSREALLTTLTPTLKELLRDSYDITRLETMIRDAYHNKLPGGPTLPVSYIPSKLPDLLKITQKKTIQFLNKGINKFDLHASVTALQDLVTGLVSHHSFHQNNEDVKIALTLKADQKTVDQLQLKKASLIDLQKFREYVNDEIDSMRETLVKNASSSMKLLAAAAAATAGGGVGGGGGDHELHERFQIILSQFQDLKRSISGYVPRQEIEMALQAILDEMRGLKRVAVEKDHLNERLKTKADKDEIERFLPHPLALSLSLSLTLCLSLCLSFSLCTLPRQAPQSPLFLHWQSRQWACPGNASQMSLV